MPKGEIGRVGQRRYGLYGSKSVLYEDFLPELQGIRGVQVYREMADNDPTVGACLFAIEMLIRQTEFHIEPGGNTAKDREAAEFVESCLDDMERSWADTLSEILSFIMFGWSYHEIVYKYRKGKTSSPYTKSKHDDGLIGWRKLPIRAQDSLVGWDYKEGTDDLVGMTQITWPDYKEVHIPLEKALHFRTRSRKDSPEGRSILRNAYRPWHFKKRIEEIEGIGIERDLAGFPVLYSPPAINVWDTQDPDALAALAAGEKFVSSVRRDEKEGAVIPGGEPSEGGWRLELLSSGGRRQFDTTAIIDRYDKRIATSMLADFVMLGQEAVGSFALADNKTKIFSVAIGAYLDTICEVFNSQGIPRLIDINGDHFAGITDYPKMQHGDIEERDLATFAAYMKTMVEIGVLTPDEQIEEEVRRLGKLPEKLDDAPPPGAATKGGEQNDAEHEAKSIYKITSILDKYEKGALTRDAAKNLISALGVDEQQQEFYLNEADKAKTAQDEAKAAQEAEKARQKAESAAGNKNTAEDAEDEKQAVKARKSLGRMVSSLFGLLR